MSDTQQQSTEPQPRAVLYARLSETYDAAESVPTQLANGERHAGRRGWRVVARLKDDGYSAFKEIKRDDFVRLIEMIERDEVDVVVIRDMDRLTRNLPDWTRFEAAVRRERLPLRDLRSASVALARAVSGARLPRPPCGLLPVPSR